MFSTAYWIQVFSWSVVILKESSKSFFFLSRLSFLLQYFILFLRNYCRNASILQVLLRRKKIGSTLCEHLLLLKRQCHEIALVFFISLIEPS